VLMFFVNEFVTGFAYDKEIPRVFIADSLVGNVVYMNGLIVSPT